jgi:N-(2-amino-2-carboxyethyl)-L-glutamate synthase
MIISSLEEIKSDNIFYKLSNFLGIDSLYIKLEGLNIAGSIKIKPAVSLIENLERTHKISPQKTTIIESSSGNLGIALSICCKQRGYRFMCVVDPNISYLAKKLMLMYGAKLIKITKKDINGGYLNTRIDKIKQIIKENSNIVWANQYANFSNTESHYQTTAKEILDQIKNIDYLFIGAGTTGTLTGCAKYFAEQSPNTKIMAVDAYGSVTFNNKSFKRLIPGLGTSRKPEIFNSYNIYDVILINEPDTIRMCHYLLKKHGLFLGGSSGAIIEAIRQCAKKGILKKDSSVVTISPDFGDKYIATIYNKYWLEKNYNKKLAKEVQDETKLFSYYS